MSILWYYLTRQTFGTYDLLCKITLWALVIELCIIPFAILVSFIIGRVRRWRKRRRKNKG